MVDFSLTDEEMAIQRELRKLCSREVRLTAHEELERKRMDAVSPLLRKPGIRPDEVVRRLQEVIFPFKVSLRKEEPLLRNALAEVEKIMEAQR